MPKKTTTIIDDVKSVIDKRIDIMYWVDVKNGNPNGEPDNSNAPRQDQVTARGKISPQCVKRKTRNGWLAMGLPIVMDSEGPTLEETYNGALKESGALKDGRSFLCRSFIDARVYGSVVTGQQQQHSNGEIHGPVQFGWAESVDPIQPEQKGLTRSIAAKKKKGKDGEDGADTGRMGNSWIVPYGLYEGHAFVSPTHASRPGRAKAKFNGTGMTQGDLNLFFKSFLHSFELDRSATRGEMTLRKVLVFKHSDAFGGARASDLFALAKMTKKSGVDYPVDYDDYDFEIDKKELNRYSKVKAYEARLNHEGDVEFVQL